MAVGNGGCLGQLQDIGFISILKLSFDDAIVFAFHAYGFDECLFFESSFVG